MIAKARVQIVVVIVMALLLAMLAGILVTRTSASHSMPDNGLFGLGMLVGALALASVLCIAMGIRHLFKTEVSDADSP